MSDQHFEHLKEHHCPVCSLAPLLGKYGRNFEGSYYRIKYRDYVDVIIFKDYIKVRCSNCKRFHKVRFEGPGQKILHS